MNHDDDLMKALRDAAQADQRAHTLPETRTSDGSEHPLLAQLTAQALAELRPVAPPLPLPKRRRWLASTTAAISLAAAAAFLLMREPGAAPMPTYRAEVVVGAELAQRGAEATGTLVYRPGAPFELTLRPAHSVEHPLDVRAFLIEGERARRLAIQHESRAHGTVTVRGEFPRVMGDSDLSLTLVVGRQGSLPEELAHAEVPGTTRVQVEIRRPAP